MDTTPAATNQTISLADLANRYLDALQRTHDVVSYSLASFRKTNEADYDEFSRQFQLMPRQEARLDFEKAKEATQRWVLRTSLADALSLVVPLMEDCRTLAEVCAGKAAGKNDPADLQRITNEARTEFLKLPVTAKFDYLAEKYGMVCEVREHILELMDISRCLTLRDGLVTTDFAPEGGALKVKIRGVQITQAPSEAAGQSRPGVLSLMRTVADTEKVFPVGERISFTKADHIGSLLTIGIALTNFLQGLQAFAVKSGAAN